MLQDTHTIRHYQKLTDLLVDLWQRGYHYQELRMYLDGYIACLRQTKTVEPYLVNRLEEEAMSYLRDPSNFELSYPQTKTQRETGFY